MNYDFKLVLTSVTRSDIFITSYKYITRKDALNTMTHTLTLTEKVFKLEFLVGMIFYAIGIILITPATTPMLIKYIAVGILLFVLLLIIIRTVFSNSEKLDERARTNFYKASNTTLFSALLFLIISVILIQFLPFSVILSPAMLSFILAGLFTTHSHTFKKLELSGE